MIEKRFQATYAIAMLRYQRCDIVKTNKNENEIIWKMQAVK